MYYRIAIQVDPPPTWQWKSTVLSSPEAVFQWLRLYHMLPHDRLRVFSCSSSEEMNEQLMQENNGLCSNSVLAAQFLQERGICLHQEGQGASDRKELGSGGNHEMASRAVITHPSSNERKGAQPVDERSMSSLERRRVELERGAGGDHDSPYTFTLPTCMPQVLAWVQLLMRLQQGTLRS